MDWSDELRALFISDQEDRQRFLDLSPEERDRLSAADGSGRRRVHEILAGGYPLSGQDQYHAAMVLEHGESVGDIERARVLALKAGHAGYRPARWLAAAALDRIRMYRGEPQVYGTQFVRQAATWTLWDVEASTTDDERAEWDVPPLQAQQGFAASLNDGSPDRHGRHEMRDGSSGGTSGPW